MKVTLDAVRRAYPDSSLLFLLEKLVEETSGFEREGVVCLSRKEMRTFIGVCAKAGTRNIHAVIQHSLGALLEKRDGESPEETFLAVTGFNIKVTLGTNEKIEVFRP